ncbi:outer membrane lipoprotein carrier protein LolA [Streptomyces sp. NPDC092296]|uniref:LolA family protein n=1 Tax=Streptomyces sp. NPDC092296 TaxID=3366012 RepID=UPI0037F4370D
MAAKRTNPMTDDEPGAPGGPGRRRAVRVLVPVAVAGVAAASIGLVPALASGSDAPALPKVSAEQLVARVLGSDARSLSGTVQVGADLGVPQGLLDGGASGALPGGGGGGQHGGGQGRASGPEARLTGLLAGSHTLRVAVDGPGRQRVGLLDKLSEYEIVHNGDQLWGWDSSSNEAVHLTLPAGHGREGDAVPGGLAAATPQQAARQVLALAGSDTALSVDGTARVAGRSAYELSVRPRQAGSTLREVRIAVDAGNGVPLRVLLEPAGGGKPVFDVHFSSVSFGRPAAGTFDFTAPKGAKVTEQRATGGKPAAGALPGLGADALNVTGRGWTSVASFRLPVGAKGGDRDALALVKGFGKQVPGGSLLSSRVVNALVTGDGTVYVGAVTPQILEHAAGAR